MSQNFKVVLVRRPGNDNEPCEENFQYVECNYPSDLADNEVLIRNCYISCDPAQRCQMNETTGVHYISPWKIDEVILGLSGVGVVESSNHPDYSPGDLIQGSMTWPWMLYFSQNLIDNKHFSKVPKTLIGDKPSLILSLFGIAGLTAFLGVRERGFVKPGANQTFVVSGGAGACGSLAGQIAKLDGCRNIVGICGKKEKCDWLTKILRFSHSINYKEEYVETRLRETCPKGIDIYFDNVGGEISDAVIKHMNPNSHIILCGQIALYNKDVPYPPPLSEEISKVLKERNITRDRYLVLDYQSKFNDALGQLAEWYFMGKIKVKETVEDGLQNAGKAFCSMMKGGNIGKQLVLVSKP